MKILQLFGFGDTNTLLTIAFRRLGLHCDALFSNHAFVTQYPAWTKKYPELAEGCYHWDSSNMYDPYTVAELFKFCRRYDLIIAHPPAGAYAWLIGRPYCMWDGGSGNFAFNDFFERKNKDITNHEIIRRSYQKAAWNYFNDIDVLYKAWPAMSWSHHRASYMPLPTDCEVFQPQDIPRSEHFTAFMPTRQEVVNKGIEQILQGFKAFTTLVPDAQLLITRYGSDVPITEYFIQELALQDHVQWVPLVPKQQLATLINTADVVIDQLGRGAVGGVTVQSMACAQRVIVDANNTWYTEQLGEALPVLTARTANDVYIRLLECYTTSHTHLKHSARAFILRHFEYNTVAKRMLKQLEEIQT